MAVILPLLEREGDTEDTLIGTGHLHYSIKNYKLTKVFYRGKMWSSILAHLLYKYHPTETTDIIQSHITQPTKWGSSREREREAEIMASSTKQGFSNEIHDIATVQSSYAPPNENNISITQLFPPYLFQKVFWETDIYFISS